MSILRRPTSLCLFLILFLSLGQLWAVEPSRHISQYAHSAWRLQDGDFSGIPTTMAQTVDGYLWVGTTSGLLRFDGVHFAPLSPSKNESSSSSAILALLGARDGALWIAVQSSRTESALIRAVNGNVTQHFRLPQERVTSIFQDRRGSIWITTVPWSNKAGILCQIVGSRTQCHGSPDEFPNVTAAKMLVEDRAGDFWLGCDTSLLHWQHGSFRAYPLTALKSHAGMAGVIALAAAPDDSLWVGVDESGSAGGLQHFVNGALHQVSFPGFAGSSLDISALLLDHENALWIGTHDRGIYRIYGNTVDHFDGSDGLSGDRVFQFVEDREGNLWVATSGGIDNFRNISVATFSKHEGLGIHEVLSTMASRDGSLWVGGGVGGGEVTPLVRFSRGEFSSVLKVPSTLVTSMFEDSEGRVWLGVKNSLYMYQHGRFTEIRSRDGKPVGMIYGITEDARHKIFVEARRPPPFILFQIEDGVAEEVARAPKLPEARRIAADPTAGIWLGLNNGDLARYRDGQTELFHFEHAVESTVDHLVVGPDGAVLAATSFGLESWKDGVQQILTTRNGLPCDGIYSFVSDNENNLWLYTKCGLIEIDNAEMQKWLKHSGTKIEYRVFGGFDGVQPASVPFSGSSRSSDGRLWFANGVAVQMIDPVHLPHNDAPPPVHIENITADRKSYPPEDGLRLPALSRNLEIDYAALSFVVPQKVRYRYKLEGHDADWQDPGTRRQAFYNDLRPAHYRFHVIACNNDGVWNNEGASIEFSIAPAWYQTNWFLLLCCAVASLAVWSFYRFRVHRAAHAISVRFDERLAERTRMARELHDTFLQTIQGSKLVVDDALKKPADHDRMQRAMEQLAVWLDQAMLQGRAALNSLRASTTQGNDLSAALKRAAEECRLQGSMEIVFSVTGATQPMHPAVGDEIYRIGYEAIRNACSHSKASRLEISLRYGRELALRVIDNGVGIDPFTADHGRDGHFGIPGMRERAIRISSRLTVVSPPNFGTEITLVVPGKIVFITPGVSFFSKLTAIVKGKNSHSISE